MEFLQARTWIFRDAYEGQTNEVSMNQIRIHCLFVGLTCGTVVLAYGFAVQHPGRYTAQASSGSMSQGSMGAENKGEAKGEKKLKGCIKTEGGQSVLEEKSGKTVNLTGSDVSAYNGHGVTVHGTWEGGTSAAASSSSGAATAKAGKTFNVTSVDMISDSCTGGKTKGGTSSTPPPTSQQ